MLTKGRIIGDSYRVRELLGKGSSGAVYLAEKEDGTLCTMKVSEEKMLLKQEARMAGEIQCEYFPGFIDYLEDERYGYLVLEYVEGCSLQSLLDGGRVFSEREIWVLMESITAALSRLHYHRTPMVHLDIKPANIIITTGGAVRIIDMGAGSMVGARLAAKGGTYGYGAPEQFWQGVLPGPEADVYACGKLMAYLFTGKNPCQPPYDAEKQMLRSCRVKKAWQRIIRKCLEMEPQRRYPDANILHREIMKLQKEFGEGKKSRDAGSIDVIYVKSIWKSDYERG